MVDRQKLWRQSHRAAGGLLLGAWLVAVATIGVKAQERSGLSPANQIAAVLAIGCVMFLARSQTRASIDRSVSRSFSTDLAAAVMLLAIATIIWYAVKEDLGR